MIKPRIKATLLAISDMHWPFACPIVIPKVQAYNKDAKPTYVLGLGDHMDNKMFGKFDNDPRFEYSFKDALDMCCGCWNTLRQDNKKGDFRVKDGNHDDRPFKYAIRNAPDLLKAGFIKTPAEMLNFNKLRIKSYGSGEKLILPGGLKITHGTAVNQLAGYSAHSEIRNSGKAIAGISGHTHRLGFVHRYDQIWLEAGNLITLDHSKLLYLGDKDQDWQQGFVVGKLLEYKTNNGEKMLRWHLQPVPIIDGYFTIDGVVY